MSDLLIVNYIITYLVLHQYIFVQKYLLELKQFEINSTQFIVTLLVIRYIFNIYVVILFT